LVLKVRYESIGTVEASQAFSRIEEDLESEWISFGTVGCGQADGGHLAGVLPRSTAAPGGRGQSWQEVPPVTMR